MNAKLIITATALTLLTGTLCGRAADISKLPPASDRKDVTYAKDIKPIFDTSCIKCHGKEKQKGKVRLDSLDAALKSKKALVVGDSAKSELVLAVALLTKEPMPPKDKGKPLTPEQIGLIRAWIDHGAK